MGCRIGKLLEIRIGAGQFLRSLFEALFGAFSFSDFRLKFRIDNGEFREDLFYRLSGFRLLVPPLRFRKDDIVMLAEYFIARAGRGKTSIELSQEAKEIMLRYDWRGNIRELENAMIRATVLAAGERMILPSHLPDYISHPKVSKSTAVASPELVSLEEIERQHITFVLSKTSSLEEAARILGIDSATLWRKRKKFGL